MWLKVSFSQITFEKAYSGIGTEVTVLSAANAEQGNTILLASKPSAVSALAFCLIKLNAYGDTLFFKPFTVSPDAEAQVVRYGNGHYYVMGIAADTAQLISTYMFWINKYDIQGNLVWSHNFSHPNIDAVNIAFGDFMILPNGNLFCSSEIYSSYFVSDSMGSLINAMRYSYQANFSYYTIFKINQLDSLFYFPKAKNFNLDIELLKLIGNLDSINPILLQLDSSKGAVRILKLLQNQILLLGCKPQPALIKPYFLTAVDTLGQFLWRKKMLNFRFETTNITSHANLLNGTTVVCGFPYSASQGPISKAFLYCFNDSGDSLWYKEFSPTDSTLKTEFYDVIATSDSGLVATGQMLRSNGIRESYIVKLDANGNLYNPLKVLEQRQQNYFYLFPNPVNEIVNIHYIGIAPGEINLEIQNLQGISVLKSECEIINRSGNWVEVKQTINLGNLPNSIYNCVLKSGLNIIQSKKLVVLH